MSGIYLFWKGRVPRSFGTQGGHLNVLGVVFFCFWLSGVREMEDAMKIKNSEYFCAHCTHTRPVFFSGCVAGD